MALYVPLGLAEVCHPDRLALVVYDMQVGIVSQMKGLRRYCPRWSTPSPLRAPGRSASFSRGIYRCPRN
jgi:hypothetical protein